MALPSKAVMLGLLQGLKSPKMVMVRVMAKPYLLNTSPIPLVLVQELWTKMVLKTIRW